MNLIDNSVDTRRNFLLHSAALLGAAALGGTAAVMGCAPKEPEIEMPATEELMQEHGVLQRLLLVHEEVARRLRCCQEFAGSILANTTALLRSYIQDHHEKLEEELIFPRFEKAGKMVALVMILREQHHAGRRLIDQLQSQDGPGAAKNFVQRAQLEAQLRLFARMYRPHAAREDTVLFPALRAVMLPSEFAALGKRLREEEERHLGQGGHEKLLREVSDLEKAMGIHDLEQFTPRF
jgi:hemerythrin-like domain-containing protein